MLRKIENFHNELAEEKIWDHESLPSDFQDYVHQENLQHWRLGRLAAINLLTYYLPQVSTEEEQSDFISMSSGKDEEQFEQLSEKYEGNFCRINRFLRARLTPEEIVDTVEFDTPKFIHRLFLRLKYNKDYLNFKFPFLMSDIVHTEPPLQKGEKYLIAIIDLDHPGLQSKLLETYVKNIATTLQDYVAKNNGSVVGASLIIKGKITRSLLRWIRGTSPLDPSKIPLVEVLFSIAVDNATTEEYIFTLKKGARCRLKKGNANLISPEAKKIYHAWQESRSYVVIDDLINYANESSLGDSPFIDRFWHAFAEVRIPTKDIPQWDIFTQLQPGAAASNNDAEKTALIQQKISAYKNLLENEIASTKDNARKRKAERLLKKMQESMATLPSNVLRNLTLIANEINRSSLAPLENLFFLDWNHIIYDTVNNKNYNKSFQKIYEINPQMLDSLNTHTITYSNECYIGINSEGETLKTNISEVPGLLSDEAAEVGVFNRVFHDIIFICGQLNYRDNHLENYFRQVFSKIPRRYIHLFAIFVEEYNKVKICFNDDDPEKKADEYGSEVFDLLYSIKDTSRLKKSVLTEENIDRFFKILESELATYNVMEYIINNIIDEDKVVQPPEDILAEFGGWDEENNTETKVTPPVSGSAPSNSNDIQSTSTLPTASKDSFTERDLVDALSTTPLFDNINLNLLKEMVEKYTSFHALTFPEDKEDTSQSSKQKILHNLFGMLSFPPGPGPKHLSFCNSFNEKTNVVKVIYVITSNKEVRIAPESLVGDRRGRPTHSELANGLGILAGGELIFRYSDGWYLEVVNNGSGHYRPTAHTSLPIAKDVIPPILKARGINISRLSVLNSLKPGMTLASGWEENPALDLPVIPQSGSLSAASSGIGISTVAAHDVSHSMSTGVTLGVSSASSSSLYGHTSNALFSLRESLSSSAASLSSGVTVSSSPSNSFLNASSSASTTSGIGPQLSTSNCSLVKLLSDHNSSLATTSIGNASITSNAQLEMAGRLHNLEEQQEALKDMIDHGRGNHDERLDKQYAKNVENMDLIRMQLEDIQRCPGMFNNRLLQSPSFGGNMSRSVSRSASSSSSSSAAAPPAFSKG